MKKKGIQLLILLICASFVAFEVTSEEDEGKIKLAYQTFVKYVENGQVKFVEISDFEYRDMKVTITKDNKEIVYFVDRPYRTDEDVVFLNFLRNHNVPYEVFEKDYSYDKNMWKRLLPAMSIFTLPLILFLALLILQIITMIRTGRIERLLEMHKKE